MVSKEIDLSIWILLCTRNKNSLFLDDSNYYQISGDKKQYG